MLLFLFDIRPQLFFIVLFTKLFFPQTYLRISDGFYRFLKHSIVTSRRYLFTFRVLSSDLIPKLYYNVTSQHFVTEKFEKRKVFITELSHFALRTFAHIFSCIFLSHFFIKVINSAGIKRYTNFSTKAT